jgi:hypothetical protein
MTTQQLLKYEEMNDFIQRLKARLFDETGEMIFEIEVHLSCENRRVIVAINDYRNKVQHWCIFQDGVAATENADYDKIETILMAVEWPAYLKPLIGLETVL